jgi:hypothetical protein
VNIADYVVESTSEKVVARIPGEAVRQVEYFPSVIEKLAEMLRANVGGDSFEGFEATVSNTDGDDFFQNAVTVTVALV